MNFANMKAVITDFIRMLGGVADILAPRTCLICDCALSGAEEHICLTCLLQLPRTYYHRDPNNRLALSMAYHRHRVDASSWLYYNSDTVVSDLIHSIKYQDMPRLGRILGRRYAEELVDDGCLRQTDVLVPVPLHWYKRYRRHYNQSELIAKGISDISGIPVVNALGARAHSPQARLNGAARRKNVTADTYYVKNLDSLKDKNIAIIDDVTTTGTTLNAVITAILRDVPDVGAIYALTLGAVSDI